MPVDSRLKKRLRSLLLSDDPRQSLRIRRSFLGIAGYLLWIIAYLIFCYLGLQRASMPVVGLICLLMLACNLVFYVIMRSGINRRFKDPSLTISQIMVGIFWVGVLSYYTDSSIRGSILILFVVIFIFGIFRLNLSQFFSLVAASIGVYGVSMVTLHYNQPAAVDLYIETIRSALLLATLSFFSLIGNYIYRLRKKMVRANGELQRALETIERIAIHDELTNIYNRRHMFTILNREKSLADRSKRSFTVCLMDLDDFKQVNDTYGHLTGDAVLKHFARAIQEDIREEDYLARYGGEEFLVVFTNLYCLENSAECAQRLRQTVERLRFPDMPPEIRITVSVGLTTYKPSESLDSLLSRADMALYAAKKNGKNRIEHIPPPQAPQEADISFPDSA